MIIFARVYGLSHNKYLVEFFPQNKSLLGSYFDAIVSAPISENFLDAIMITDFPLSHNIELKITSAKPRFFRLAK